MEDMYIVYRINSIHPGVVTTQSDRTLDSGSTKAQNQNGARGHYSEEDENDAENPDDDEDSTPVNILEMQGIFDDMIVWDHEKLPESDDAFVKGIHEWIGFANAVSLFFCYIVESCCISIQLGE